MPSFSYKALGPDGSSLSGRLDAPDRQHVLRRLQALRARPLSITELPSAPAPATREQRSQTPKPARPAAPAAPPDAASPRSPAPARSLLQALRPSLSGETLGLTFLKRLLELHAGGLPIGDCVRLLQQRLSDPSLKSLAQGLWRELSEGRTIAETLRARPREFPESITFVIEAGEATGNLAPVLERIVAQLEEKQEIRRRIAGGLAYPAFLATAALAVALYLVFGLLPQMRGMITSLGGKVNWSMQLLMEGSRWFLYGGPVLLAAAIITIIALLQWRRTPTGRLLTDRAALLLPLFGPILRIADLFQLNSLLATLLGSGVNMTETLRLTGRTLQNRDLRERFQAARTQVNEGLALSAALRLQNLFSPLHLDILAVGENTGNIVHSLQEIARIQRRELDQRLHFLITGLTGGALGLTFLLVGLVALSMVSSVFQVSRTLSF